MGTDEEGKIRFIFELEIIGAVELTKLGEPASTGDNSALEYDEEFFSIYFQ